MKKFNILAASLIAMIALACNKDNSTPGDHPLPEITVTGIQETYAVLAYKDTLRINPTVSNEELYDYFWTAYTSNFVQGTGKVPKADTLATTKNLSYKVQLNPGPYILVFNVKDKKTGVTKLVNKLMNVSTLTMNGWYLLKDKGGKTDVDFIYADGRINDWISFFNEGRSMDGGPVDAVFTPAFKMSPAAPPTEIFNALTILSEKDALICRIDNGKIVRTFDDMFFNTPATRKLQSVFQPVNQANIGLINDGKPYSMTKGTLFSNMPPNSYKISPITAVGATTLAFDENSKSVILIDGALLPNLSPAKGGELKNMNADIVWMNGYSGFRTFGMALFRKADATGLLIKLDIHYSQLIGSPINNVVPDLVVDRKTLPASHGLMNANAIGGNYDADYVYYAIANKVYLTDIATTQENLQVTLPAGENVTSIQHIKYPQPASAAPATTDFLAIATFSNGHYKVYLHKISSTGTIQPIATPNFEGDGRVTTVIYMEQGNGSRVF